jgi:hypothetical protein
MRIAIIENDVVINVIEANEEFASSIENETIVESSETGNAYLNGDLKNGKFRPPMPENALSWNDANWCWILPIEESI